MRITLSCCFKTGCIAHFQIVLFTTVDVSRQDFAILLMWLTGQKSRYLHKITSVNPRHILRHLCLFVVVCFPQSLLKCLVLQKDEPVMHSPPLLFICKLFWWIILTYSVCLHLAARYDLVCELVFYAQKKAIISSDSQCMLHSEACLLSPMLQTLVLIYKSF